MKILIDINRFERCSMSLAAADDPWERTFLSGPYTTAWRHGILTLFVGRGKRSLTPFKGKQL